MAKHFVNDRRLDTRRRAAVDVALSLAELNASWQDYERALEHLAAAEELALGGLDERAAALRREWVGEALIRPTP